MKLLLISDSEMIAQNISGILSEQKPILVRADRAREACDLLSMDEFDLVILDLDLLGDKAQNVLRDCPPEAFTLALANRTDKQKVLEAIKAGASDFIMKPLDATLFRLRIGMALAHPKDQSRDEISFGDLMFNVTDGSIEFDGERLSLTPTENTLLLALMRRGGALVNKEFLSRSLCQSDDWMSNSAVEVYVHRLRRKLCKTRVKIETVRGLGYVLQHSEI